MRQRWRDARLSFKQQDHYQIIEVSFLYAKTFVSLFIQGESWLADKIWTPNIFIENEV